MDNYKFDPLGSMGSSFQNTANPVYPPEGCVITAIQFLADNILTRLVPERKAVSKGHAGQKYIGTHLPNGGAAAASHSNGDTAAAVTAGNGNASGPTITLGGADANIRVGQKIVGHANFPWTNDDATGIPPIYVAKYDGATTVTLSRNAALPNGTSMYFMDPLGTGYGGVSTVNAVFPKGMTIYGRWDEVTPTVDANGGIICYFGRKK